MRGSHRIPPVGTVRSATSTGRGLRSAATATPRAKDDKHHRSPGAHARRRGSSRSGRRPTSTAGKRSSAQSIEACPRTEREAIEAMTRLYTNTTPSSWPTRCANWRRLSQQDTPRLTRERRCVGSRMTPTEDICRSYGSSPGAFDNSQGPAREPASTIRSCTSSKPPNLNHHSKSCSVGCGCWKSYAGYRQRSVPVTGLSCRRWENIKRSSARSAPSHGPRCEGSQTCASWHEVRQTRNSVQWRRSACPLDSGQSRRYPCPTMEGPSDMQGPKGGGGSTRKKQGLGRASGVSSCKCCGRAMVSRPPGPRGSLPGPPCTEASQSWWAGRSPTARRCAGIHGAGMGRRSCASLGHRHNRCCDGGAGRHRVCSKCTRIRPAVGASSGVARCRSPRLTNTGESQCPRERVPRCSSGHRGCGPTSQWQTKRKGALFDLLGCNHVRQPARKGAAPVRNRRERRGRSGGRENEVLQAVAAASELQGVKRGRADMVRGALLDMFAAVRQMVDGCEGSQTLLQALRLVI